MKELLDIALDCIFPTSESIEPEILKEITNFLEQHQPSAPSEDAEIVRGEIRKALIHFKNRPYLYNTRKKISDLLMKNENWKKFVIAPQSFMKEMEEAGLSADEMAMLKSSIENAEVIYSLLRNIPQP
ncbi:MAG: hypothetical protein ACTSPI_02605 [Candidatus Heimdallarchaeaceae archaeon]